MMQLSRPDYEYLTEGGRVSAERKAELDAAFEVIDPAFDVGIDNHGVTQYLCVAKDRTGEFSGFIAFRYEATHEEIIEIHENWIAVIPQEITKTIFTHPDGSRINHQEW